MTVLAPLTFAPLLVPKPWGGRRLADLGRDLPAGVPVGESWDIADLDPAATTTPDPMTRVAHGPLLGASLQQVISTHAADLLGSTEPSPGGRFPLLVKHLDARENLSVQVHPPADVVPRHPGAHLKTESWVVVAADPGAELMLGVADGVTLADVEHAFGTAGIVPLLRRVPATVGDVHHVPAGLLHALGAGVVVAEPQTPSDTTYRVYDWTEEYGRAPRDLHRDQALDCLRSAWSTNTGPPAAAHGDGLLVQTRHYSIRRTTAPGPTDVQVPPRDTARVLIGLAGALTCAELPQALGAGGVALLPAAWSGSLQADADSIWLDVDLQ